MDLFIRPGELDSVKQDSAYVGTIDEAMTTDDEAAAVFYLSAVECSAAGHLSASGHHATMARIVKYLLLECACLRQQNVALAERIMALELAMPR